VRKTILLLMILYIIMLHNFSFSYDGYSEISNINPEEYKPIIYARSDDMPYRIAYYYDADQGSINYLVFWNSEKTGYGKIIDTLYSFIRTIVYGQKDDIEMIRVYPSMHFVNFESVEHRRAYVIMGNNEYFENGTHIILYSILPNHIFYLYNENQTLTNNYTKVNLKLTPLTPGEYLKYNIHFRWDGSIKNRFINLTIVFLLLYLIITNWEKIITRVKAGVKPSN